jgi:hypothetical protein
VIAVDFRIALHIAKPLEPLSNGAMRRSNTRLLSIAFPLLIADAGIPCGGKSNRPEPPPPPAPEEPATPDAATPSEQAPLGADAAP